MNDTLKQNPDFTEDETLDDTVEDESEEGDEEVKEPADDESEESESSTDSSDDNESSPTEQALDREEEKLAKENEELELRLQEKRDRIVEQRRKRRELRQADREVADEPEDDPAYELEDVDPDEVDRFKKIAKATGYVPKSEIEAETLKAQQKAVETDFFTAHPEYLPENDADDKLYDAFRQEVSLYAKPTSVGQMKDILEKVHREVAHKNPSAFKKETKGTRSTGRTDLARKAGGSAGAASAKKTGPSSIAPEQRQYLQGFSDEELEEM